MDEQSARSSVEQDSSPGHVEPMLPALGVVVDHLLLAARQDETLRAALRQLAEQILDATAAAQHELPTVSLPDEADATPPDPAELTSPARESEQVFFQARPRPQPQPQPPTFASASPSAAAASVSDTDRFEAVPSNEVADEELSWIERRSRLKAEATRWAVTRMRRLEQGADYRSEIEPQDKQLIEQARPLPDCFLWMCHVSSPAASNLAWWHELAGCFELQAEAVGLVRRILEGDDQDRDLFEPALDLLAAAQSALRVAVIQLHDREDADQRKVHLWLRRTTQQQSIYITRHMRLDDPANPADLPQLEQQLEKLRGQWQSRDEARRKRRSRLNRIRYHLDQLERGAMNPQHDWLVIVRTVDELVSDGTPPSDTQLRELLLPWLEQMPDLESVPASFERVLREIDRYLASRPSDDPAAAPTIESPQVGEVRRLLAGRGVMLVGGLRRPQSQANLKQAFGLSELRWDDTTPHQSLDDFEPAIARPEVAVVLLAIRWSSHSFGGLKAICDRHGKPLVRLPAGYGVNRVAAEILEQCSEQLVGGH